MASLNVGIKAVLVGSSATGKTWITIRWVTHRLPDVYVPTVFDYCDITREVDKTKFTVSLYDTCRFWV